MSRCNRATEISLDRSPQFVRQARSIKQPSRMRNGTALLPDIDGRSHRAALQGYHQRHSRRPGCGSDQCSESRLQLVRRFAAAAVLAEQLESRLANGEQN
jgi:hypothetical protein